MEALSKRGAESAPGSDGKCGKKVGFSLPSLRPSQLQHKARCCSPEGMCFSAVAARMFSKGRQERAPQPPGGQRWTSDGREGVA